MTKFSPLLWAWRAAPKLPAPLLYGALQIGADFTWLRRTKGVRRLESNLLRVQPNLSKRQLRKLSRIGMRSYMRYYADVLSAPAMTTEQLAARVRISNIAGVNAELAAGRSVVLALGHLGNWDWAGAWAAKHFGSLVTVAERLKPEELFQEFKGMRESLGMTIYALESGSGGSVFRELLRDARSGGTAIALLADRDLTSGGIEVPAFGELTRVAAGPAALSIAAGIKVFPTVITYERLYGQRRRAAGRKWGIHVDFQEAVSAADFPDAPKDQLANLISETWYTRWARGIKSHPQDWHMLQRVFVSDLDPTRDAKVRAAGGEGT